MSHWRSLSPSNKAFAVFLVSGCIGGLLIHPSVPFLLVACVALVVSVGLTRQGRDGGDG